MERWPLHGMKFYLNSVDYTVNKDVLSRIRFYLKTFLPAVASGYPPPGAFCDLMPENRKLATLEPDWLAGFLEESSNRIQRSARACLREASESFIPLKLLTSIVPGLLVAAAAVPSSTPGLRLEGSRWVEKGILCTPPPDPSCH